MISHSRRDTRAGAQCDCGAPFWSLRHVVFGTVAELLYAAGDWIAQFSDHFID